MSDREILIEALTSSLNLYKQKSAGATLLGQPRPDQTVLGPIQNAIERCPSYHRIAGKMVFTAWAGMVLHSPRLAVELFDHARYTDDVQKAADWLLRILNTKTADGRFVAALWGVSLEGEVQVGARSKMISFGALPESQMKKKIQQRARSNGSNAPWLAHAFYDVPGVAFTTEVCDLPYISADGSPFAIMEGIWSEASEIWTLIQAVSVGHPLAIGYWFEYLDQDLDLSAWDNTLSWSLPEVIPQIRSVTPINASSLESEIQCYAKLPESVQNDLVRSMNRFILSQCRRQQTDLVIDLALAFEIAVSGERNSAPISWKISHRSAQFIGGPIETRKRNRKVVNDLYTARNRAAHAGNPKQGGESNRKDDAANLYRDLIKTYLRYGREPDWEALDFEPPST